MVDSLKIEVELQGGEKVKQDLQNIGLVGVQAFRSLATAAAGFSAALAAGIGIATVAVTKRLYEFANAAEETEKALTQLQKVSGQSIGNLSALATAFAGGGTELKKFATEFGNLAEKIAGAGQGAAIRNAGKDTAEWANDLEQVRGKFDRLNLSFSSLTTLDTKVKALLESLSRVPAADQWARLADIFNNLRTEMERAQIGKALGLSPETIATLSQGSAALQQMEAEAQRLGLTLTTSNQQALQEMTAQWNQFTALVAALFQKIGAAAAPAFAALYQTFKTVTAAIAADFENLPLDQALANLGNRLAPAFAAVMQLLQPIFIQIGQLLLEAAGTMGAEIGKALGRSIINGVLSIFKAEKGSILDRLFSGGTPAPAASGGGNGFAGGGWVGGRGSGTSDSNLAWLSRGEYVTPARAVAQPGVLSFLEALRHSGGNLSRVLDGMGRFALGGLVPRGIPAFATGGLAGGSNVTIQFPGLPPIGGLRASSDVVEQLHRAAALAQVRSGGRKPSRYS